MPIPVPIEAESRPAGPALWLVLAMCAAYLAAGVIGHDPWKSEDAIHLAIAHGFATGGSLLLPSLAGEPLPNVEPLYHWLAAGSAAASGFLLPFHDGARLATAFCGGLFLFLLGAAARQLYGAAAGYGAPLLAIGTLGLLVPLHEAQPAAAVLAAAAATYLGVARLAVRPAAGTLLLACGLGASFLAGGLAAGLPLLPLLALPLGKRQWLPTLVALALAAVLAALWPWALASHDPKAFAAWWAAELATTAPQSGFGFAHLQWLGWFAWPVLFIAPWTGWRDRRQWRELPQALPLLGLVAGLLWFVTHEARTGAALPLLPPLILLAASGTARLRRGAANAWDWFGMMTLSLVAALLWLAWVAMLSGWPAKLAANIARLEPGFVARFSPLAFLVAALATALWIVALLRLPRSPWRVASRWAAGVTLIWVLVASLIVPWIDYGKTYRPVVASLRQALPENAGCIGRRGLGLPQRAALDYFAGIRTRPGSRDCDWLVAQSGSRDHALPGWTRVWEGHRPGDRREWLLLYRRD
jgi:4-amino-4-deoxy-L-arabinose transferase-like glycosyltransferase